MGLSFEGGSFENFSFDDFAFDDVFRLHFFGQRLIPTISLSPFLCFVGRFYHQRNKATTAATLIAMPIFSPEVRPAERLQRQTSYDGALAKILPVPKEGSVGFPGFKGLPEIEFVAAAEEEADTLLLVVLVMNCERVEFDTAFMLERVSSILLAIQESYWRQM